MAKEDNDLLDRALDAAEEKITADAPVTEEASAKEAVEAEPVEAKEEISDEKADVEPTVTEEVPETVTEAVTLPTSLSPKVRALLSKAPPELQQALVEEEIRKQQVMGRLANETQRAKSWETRVNSDFQSPDELNRHRATLKTLGVNDEIEELHRYRAWSSVIKSDPLTAIRSLIVQHGITPNELSGEYESDPSQYQSAPDPRVDELAQKLDAWEKEKEQALISQREQAFASEVTTWKSGNDRYGKPRADFSALYAPQIDGEWNQILNDAAQNGIQMSLEESLTEAFNRVQDKIYKTHGINPQVAKPSREQLIANSQKSQAAVTKATGAPRTEQITQKPTQKKKYKNDKEWVEDAMRRAEERRGAAR